jgi:hypothetical protein
MLETRTDNLRSPNGVQRLQFDNGPARCVLVQGLQEHQDRVHIHRIPAGSGRRVHSVDDLDRIQHESIRKIYDHQLVINYIDIKC